MSEPNRTLYRWTRAEYDRMVRVILGDKFYIRGQKPLAIDARSEPEPDVAVIAGSIRDYTDHHPRTAILLVMP